MHELPIRCLPENIPSHISLEISHLLIGDSILIRELELENVTINYPGDQTLVSIMRPREIIELEEEEDEEGLEGEEGVEGEGGEAADSEQPKEG